MEINLHPVNPCVYKAMQTMDIGILSRCTEQDLRPALPYLVRMSLCAPIDHSDEWRDIRKNLLKILSDIDTVNTILALLSIDFHALEEDTRKEQQLRCKIGGKQSDSILISQLEDGITREFEQSDADRKLRLILSEMLFIISKVKEAGSEFTYKACELFEDLLYVEELSDVLCIAHAELPSLLPITDLAEALLRVENGAWILCKILTNTPESFLQVCHHLIHLAETDDDESVISQRRTEAMESLCQLCPLEDLHIRELCVTRKVMPVLVLSITLRSCCQRNDSGNHGDDLVQFLTGRLLSNDHGVRTWLSQFIKTSPKRKEAGVVVDRVREELLKQLRDIVPEDGCDLWVENAVRASGLIRLYCALKGMAAIKFSDNETYWLLRLLTSRTTDSPATHRFIQLSICMLLACPNLLLSQGQEKIIIAWIRHLMNSTNSPHSNSQSYRDMLFLIAIHFHGGQRDAIADLVSTTLGMKSAVKPNALNKIRDIFTKEIFTEQVITTHAASLPIIPDLNANLPGYLSVHSVYQLLKNRTFSKYKVPIQEWIFQQLRSVAAPLHPVIPPLIEAFVQSIILPGARAEFTNQPITEQQILSVFRGSVLNKLRAADEPMELGEGVNEGTRASLLSQLLMVYYVLLYEDVRHANMRTILTYKRPIAAYSIQLISQLPISHVVLATQRDGSLTTDLFSSLLRLLTTHYPHLCLVPDWLDNTLLISAPRFDDLSLSRQSNVTLPAFKKETFWRNFLPFGATIPDLEATFLSLLWQAVADLTSCHEQSFATLHWYLDALSTKSATDLIDYTEVFLSTFPCLLRDNVPRKIIDLAKNVWFKLHCVVPRHLRLLTVKTLQTQSEMPSSPVSITDKDVTVDPLVVLRCDPRVFRCAPLLEINLRVLSAYLQACRVHLSTHIQENPIMDKSLGGSGDTEREELKNALVTAQESAAVQMLLESCLKQPSDDEGGLLTNLQEVRGLVCSHLHQMFIADPNLAKLVHFQGYDTELLAMTVSGIPSMHICLDFIPELISQPQIEKQVFAINLVSHLCTQYALPKTMGVAKLVIDVMFTLVEVFHQSERATFFHQTLPCLVLICSAFPPLCDDVTSLLMQIGRVTISHLSASGLKHPKGMQDSHIKELEGDGTSIAHHIDVKAQPFYKLYETVQNTFQQISKNALVNKNLY